MTTPTTNKSIGLAADHAGFELKEYIKKYLEAHNLTYKDYGTHSPQSCDYPDYAHLLGHAIDTHEVEIGIAICGSGEGISMTLNKHQSVRAALVWNTEIAHMTRMHNDANVLVMPGRYTTPQNAEAIVNEFLHTPFEGGRHTRRIQKIPLKS